MLIGLEIIKSNAYVLVLKRILPEFSISTFYKKSLLSSLFIFATTLLLLYLIHYLYPIEGWSHFLFTLFGGTFILTVLMFFIGLNVSQRKKLCNYLLRKHLL